jgi:hypothetical protein
VLAVAYGEHWLRKELVCEQQLLLASDPVHTDHVFSPVVLGITTPTYGHLKKCGTVFVYEGVWVDGVDTNAKPSSMVVYRIVLHT